MAKKFLVNIDLGGNQLLNTIIHSSATAPSVLGAGQLWYDSSNNLLNVYNGSSFVPLATGGTAVTSLNSLTGAVNIYGTANNVAVSAGSGSITLSLPATISTTTACATNFYGSFNGTATNSTQLGGIAAASYAQLSSANFTAASVGGSRVTTTSDKLSVFANTTSAELAGIISDETGTGSLVFSANPTFTGTVNGSAITLSGALTASSGTTTLGTTNVGAFTATSGSIGSNAIATQSYVTGTSWTNSNASVGYATNAGNANTVTNGVYTTSTGVVTSTMIADGTIVNVDISATAGIVPSKLSASTVTVGSTAIGLGGTSTTLAGLTNVNSTSFVGALFGNATTVTNGVYTTDTGTVTSTMIADGTIVNGDISSTAAITPNKLSASTITIGGTAVGLGGTAPQLSPNYLTASTVTVGSTAIGLGGTSTTLAGLSSVTSTSFVGTLFGNAATVTNGVYTTDSGTVTSAMIQDGTIVNGDISATAAIVPSKLSASAITIAGTSVGLGGTLSSIGVSYLSASTTTIGSTAIGLGGSSTALAGLTKVTTSSAAITDTSDSTSTSTGALVVSGGTGIAKNLYVGGDLSVTGSVYIAGSAFNVNASNVTLNDPMIYLAHNNASNVSDIGIVGSFTSGSYQHTGLVRDATDNIWKLFSYVIPEPTTTINFASATYDSLLTGGLEIWSSSTTKSASITSTGSATFARVTVSGGTSSQFLKADGSTDSTTYAPLNSPTFTGTVNLGTNVATGSVTTAQNAASLGGLPAASYAQLNSSNFVAASVGGNRVITTADKFTALTATVTSSEIFNLVSDEVGTGSLVFNTSPRFAGTVDLGTNVATGSVNTALNSASLGGKLASAYAELTSSNFTAASVGGIAIARKFAQVIVGDNATKSFTVTHGMNTRDVTVQVYQFSATPDTQWAEVEVDIVRSTTSAVAVSFATAPLSTSSYSIVVVG